jgi:hypothetical protein
VLGKHTLMSGEKTELKAIFETAGRPGPFRKIVSLSTNIPGQEDIEVFSMTGSVKEEPSAKIQIDPRRVLIHKIEPGMVRKQDFTIKNNGTIPLVISKIYAQTKNHIYYNGAKEGNIILKPGQTKSLELLLELTVFEKQSEEMIVFVTNARNANKGNYMVIVQRAEE